MKYQTISNLKRAAMFTAAWCVIINLVACNKPASNTSSQSPKSFIEEEIPASSVNTIDSLAFFMVKGLWEEPTLENFEQTYHTQAQAMKSHWILNQGAKAKDTDDEAVYRDVANELKEYADMLSEGSTFDMTLSADVRRTLSRFATAKLYCEKYKDNPLYKDEMRDWLSLNKDLEDFYGNLASLINWGGSIRLIVNSGTCMRLSVCREKDYENLHQGADAPSSDMTIDKARTELKKQLAAAMSLEADPDLDKEDLHDFNETLNEMKQSADQVEKKLNQWLQSRNKLCNALGIPESQTADMVNALGILIKTMIEE